MTRSVALPSVGALALLALLLPAGAEASPYAGPPAGDDPAEWRAQRPRLQRRRWNALEERPAPSLTTLEGWVNTPPMTWESLRGRLVLVCVWSAEERRGAWRLKHLAELAADFADELTVIAVHAGPATEDARNVLERAEWTLPFATDAGGDFGAALAVRRPPAYFLVDREGRVRVAGVSPDIGGGGCFARVVEAVAAEGGAAAQRLPAGGDPRLYRASGWARGTLCVEGAPPGGIAVLFEDRQGAPPRIPEPLCVGPRAWDVVAPPVAVDAEGEGTLPFPSDVALGRSSSLRLWVRGGRATRLSPPLAVPADAGR